MKLNKDAKIAILLVAAFFLLVALYAADAVYSNYTGKLETEYILPYSETQTVSVDGFAVRDENINISGKNTSIFYKDDYLVYVPVISDSENIGKNSVIALGFADESQSAAYLQAVELEEKLAKIKENANKQGLNHSNVLFLNSQISNGISGYVKAISDGVLDDAQSYIESVSGNITSKQNAIGEETNYDDLIADYTKQIKNLKASYKISKRITAPFAGYFVSDVDGYEAAVSYNDVANKKVQNGYGEKFTSMTAEDTNNAYGKLIAQHTWYYVFDIKAAHASVIKPNYWVSVAFNDVGIDDVDMLVYDVGEEKAGKITVTLKCTAMNDELARIRKDKATITVKKYKGYKINNDAIRENESGVMGVYVVVGNIIKFAPIEILYYTDDYVIAEGIRLLKDENDSSLGYYHKLKQYDKIIVKGRNLEDGNIVS